MKKTPRLKKAITAIEGLSRAELANLQPLIDTLLSKGYLDIEPTGTIEYKFITKPNGKRYGPYKYRRVWVDGKLTSHYEGLASQEEYEAWLKQKK